MQGREQVFPPVIQLTLRTDKIHQDNREEFLRVQCRSTAQETTELVCYPQQGSGVISSMPWASGLARLPAGVPIGDGAKVAYYDLHHWLS